MNITDKTSELMTKQKKLIPIRAFIISILLGSALTLINQPESVSNNKDISLILLVSAYLTPFFVVLVNQYFACTVFKNVFSSSPPTEAPSAIYPMPIKESIVIVATSVAIVLGSVNLFIYQTFLTDYTISITAILQMYLLPLIFGGFSQIIFHKKNHKALHNTCYQ